MFIKMLKSELRHNKGLNIVLFIFIAIASVLVFAGTVQIYSYFTCEDATAEYCHSSYFSLMISSRRGRIDQRRKTAEEVFAENGRVLDHSRLEMNEIPANRLDFENFDEKNSHSFREEWHYITTMPEKFDLVFGLDDKPFTVPNGCVAVPVSVRNITGAKIGGKLRITTEMGYIYELTICGFFKDQIGMNFGYRYILSEDDYNVISADSHYISDLYSFSFSFDESTGYDPVTQGEAIRKRLDEKGIGVSFYSYGNITDESVMMMIVSVFVVLISIFMILIILMTVRFTIIASLKEEEKEIGMMRAMGVDSPAFRWLFAAKYIGFTLCGGIVGLLLGVPVSRILFGAFSPNMTEPSVPVMMTLGALSVLAIAAVMILFSLGVMRRINKISVIDAIHGENRGERFGSSAVIFLYKRNRMPVPLYLAVSDILKRFKRYLFLLISYILGISIMLITVNLRNSVISEQFMCYSSCYSLDFAIEMKDDSFSGYMVKRARSSGKSVFSIINEDFKAAGIPAEMEVTRFNHGTLIINDHELTYEVFFDGTHPERYTYRDGGCAPKLENEIAMSYYQASRYGLQVGDTIDFELYENAADNMSGEYHKKQLVITGFIDAVEDNGGIPFAIMGADYKDGFSLGKAVLSCSIFTEESEKPAVIERMRELYPNAEILDGKQNAKRYLSEYDNIFAMLEYIMGGTVIFVTILMTYLYMNIFIAEETRDIALLKSMGFTDGSIRAWQMLRLVILTAASAVIAVIFVKTAGTLFMRKLFELVPLTGFSFVPEYLFSFGIIPVGALLTICAAAMIKLTAIGRISVARINEE